MSFKTGQQVSVLHSGSLVSGTVVDTAKDDAGNYAYQVEAPDNALGIPPKWVKAGDVFVVEPSPEEKKLKAKEQAEALNKVLVETNAQTSSFLRPRS